MKQLLIIALAFAAAGCGAEFIHNAIHQDGCQPEQFRCLGSELQICNADQVWEQVAECTAFEPGDWACCDIGEIRCAKVEYCK